MNRLKWMRRFLITSFVMMSAAVSTQAITSRAFVSSTGNDANTATNCAQSAPCRTFASAISVVSTGGELVALDSSGYGPVTVNKSITIAAVPGETAFIIVAGGTNGMTINPGANVAVTLRNLNLNGQGSASSIGILQQSGNVNMQNVTLVQLATGLKVTGGATNVDGGAILNNTVGVRAEGQGPDQSPMVGLNPARVSVVRISGAFISFNATAFQMHNPGQNAGGSPGVEDTRGNNCNAQNIFIRSENNVTFNNIVGNTTLLTLSGLAETNLGCGQVFVGTYTTQTTNQSTPANQ